MMKLTVVTCVALACAGIAAPLQATVLTYTISGTGSGALDGVSFDGVPFVFTLRGDTANIAPLGTGSIVLSPLASASFMIGGSSGVFSSPTRLGTANSGTIVFLAQVVGGDFFDFFLTVPVNIDAAFGAVTGTDVYGLEFFNRIPTTAGPLRLSRSSDVVFAGAAVPEPASWALLTSGFGLVGATMRGRRNLIAERTDAATPSA